MFLARKVCFVITSHVCRMKSSFPGSAGKINASNKNLEPQLLNAMVQTQMLVVQAKILPRVPLSVSAAAKSLQSYPTLSDTTVVSDSVRPHRQQPTRLPRPWDSPGKNTGVGCHFLLQCMKVKSESEVTESCLTLSDPMDCRLPSSSSMGFSRQE